MYAGVDYNEDDYVTPGDLVVPYLDMPWHNGVVEDDELRFLWSEYVPAVVVFLVSYIEQMSHFLFCNVNFHV